MENLILKDVLQIFYIDDTYVEKKKVKAWPNWRTIQFLKFRELIKVSFRNMNYLLRVALRFCEMQIRVCSKNVHWFGLVLYLEGHVSPTLLLKELWFWS